MGSLTHLGIGVGVALGVGILTVVGLKMFLGKKKRKVTLEASNVNYPLQLVDRVGVKCQVANISEWAIPSILAPLVQIILSKVLPKPSSLRF